MTEYRLPDALGGHPVNVISRGGHGDPSSSELWKVVAVLPDESFPLWLPGTVLVEVEAPLPPEPGLHAVVLDGMGRAWQHVVDSGRGPWCCTRGDLGGEWEDVCESGAPALLVLDPFAEKVELPWASQPYAPGIMRTCVRLTSDGVEDENSTGHTGVAVVMPPERARTKGLVLIAAADAVEAQQATAPECAG